MNNLTISKVRFASNRLQVLPDGFVVLKLTAYEASVLWNANLELGELLVFDKSMKTDTLVESGARILQAENNGEVIALGFGFLDKNEIKEIIKEQ